MLMAVLCVYFILFLFLFFWLAGVIIHDLPLEMVGKRQFISGRAISPGHCLMPAVNYGGCNEIKLAAAPLKGYTKPYLGQINTARFDCSALLASRRGSEVQSDFWISPHGDPEVRPPSREIVYAGINYSYSIKLLDYRLVNMCADVSYV